MNVWTVEGLILRGEGIEEGMGAAILPILPIPELLEELRIVGVGVVALPERLHPAAGCRTDVQVPDEGELIEIPLPVADGVQDGSKSSIGTMDTIELDETRLQSVDVWDPEAVGQSDRPVTAHVHAGGHEIGGTVGSVQHHLVTG